jgi:hypothetical protein
MEALMKALTSTLLASGLVLIATPQSAVCADSPQHTVVLDVAVDCTTIVSGPNRGDSFIIAGKLFPGGTFPAADAPNQPTEPFNNVAPIGEYAVRGQHSVAVGTTSIGPKYNNAPTGFATIYFTFNDNRNALIAEGYSILQGGRPGGALTVIAGGIGTYSGAAGDMKFDILGRNASGCANSRATFHIQPGSVRGNSNK